MERDGLNEALINADCLRRIIFFVEKPILLNAIARSCFDASALVRDAARQKKRQLFPNKCYKCCVKDGGKRCGRCKTVKYCSAECQRADWAEHKSECGLVPQMNGVLITKDTTTLLFKDGEELHKTLEGMSKSVLWQQIIAWDKKSQKINASADWNSPQKQEMGKRLLAAMNCAVMIMCLQNGYDFQELEKELRDRNTATWLGAEDATERLKSGFYTLNSVRPHSAKPKPRYSIIVHMGPQKYCMGKIEAVWRTYEANFEALDATGFLCVSDSVVDKLPDSYKRK